MKGGYKRCEMLDIEKDIVVYNECLKEENAYFKKENAKLNKDNKYLLKSVEYLNNDFKGMRDRYYTARDESFKYMKLYEKFKARFGYAGGCAIGFAILWLCELFLN